MKNQEIIRFEYPDARVTAKTPGFRLAYLPASAQRRHARAGRPLLESVQNHSTPSFCKHEPLFLSRADAQARADARNAAEFRGEKCLHVLECFAVPPAPPRAAKSAAEMEREIAENHRADVENGLSESAASESDAFERRVLGLDEEDSE